MKIGATFRDLVQAQTKKATGIWNKLPEMGKVRVGKFGLGVFGVLTALTMLRGIQIRRYGGAMSEKRLREYFEQSGMVQDAHSRRRNSHMMGSATTQDHMRRLFRT